MLQHRSTLKILYKEKEASTKDHISYDSINMKFNSRQIYTEYQLIIS